MAESMQRYYGIDFGTTHSATVGFSVIGKEVTRFLYGDVDERPMPSVVAINRETGDVLTGRDAWNRKTELSDTCEYISSIKTILDTGWTREIAGRTWSSVDVAAEVFRALKRIVDSRSPVPMTEAVVAIPVGFSAGKRRELRQAAGQAGIRISSFVSEPTAAFCANYADLKSCSVLAVFDWGGGTLDVSVLKNEKGKVTELASGGMNIAGDYIDRKLAQRVHARLARHKGKTGIGFDDMPHAAQDLLLVRSERAKRQLSDNDEATIAMGVTYGDFGSFKEIIDYDWFCDIIEPEVTKAMECLEKVIEDSGVGLANIDRIAMVGGSSNLRPLTDRMNKKYGDILYFPEQTMWNVSQGAAILSCNPGDFHSSQAIDLILSNGSHFPLLKPGTGLSNWSSSFFFGLTDTTNVARLVFGGCPDIDESDDRYRSLEIPNYRFLQEKIKLEAMVDQDLVFSVTARSSMQPSSFGRIWEYEKLKCYYDLPEDSSLFE